METRHAKSGALLMRTLDRLVPMRSVWLAIILCLGLAIPAYAATIFSEDFEAADYATFLSTHGWLGGDIAHATTDLFTMTGHTGASTRVLRLTYQGIHVNDCCNSSTTKFFSPQPEIYVRYYFRTEPIPPATQSSYSNITGKQHYLKTGGTSDGTPNTVLNHRFGSRAKTFGDQGNWIGGGVNHTPNMANIPLQDNRWYCIEYHVKMNTPNEANGVAEIWVDGAQTLGEYSIGQRDTAHANAAFTSLQIYRQGSDNMYRYEDDMVVATTRVGCSGTPPASADSTPPAAPLGLTLR